MAEGRQKRKTLMVLPSRTVGGSVLVRCWAAGAEDRGAELFESALVVPLLFTLLLGVCWMGRAYNVYETITRAAREGARYAVLPNCATCGDTYADSYTSLNSCLSNPTTTFSNYVSPALAASSMDPNKIQNYCQKAAVLDPDSDGSVQQCGVTISFTYPVKLTIPFMSLNGSTINIPTSVQMRFENQSVDSNGNPKCP
jgi:Flp pilus assembly protein TadG